MPVLDSCIAGTYTPGNIGASSGLTPVVRTVPPTTPTITSSATASVDEDLTLAFGLTSDTFLVIWTIVGGVDQAQFEISGSTLRWVSDGTQDYETPLDDDADNVYEVTVRATNSSGNYDELAIGITVNNVVPPVTDRQAMAGNVFANTTGAGQVMTPGLMIDES